MKPRARYHAPTPIYLLQSDDGIYTLGDADQRHDSRHQHSVHVLLVAGPDIEELLFSAVASH